MSVGCTRSGTDGVSRSRGGWILRLSPRGPPFTVGTVNNKTGLPDPTHPSRPLPPLPLRPGVSRTRLSKSSEWFRPGCPSDSRHSQEPPSTPPCVTAHLVIVGTSFVSGRPEVSPTCRLRGRRSRHGSHPDPRVSLGGQTVDGVKSVSTSTSERT